MLIQQVIILFILILIGFVLKKTGLLNDVLNRGLTDLLLTICVPFTIFTSFLHIQISPAVLMNMAIALFCAFFVQCFAAVLGKLLYIKYPAKTGKILLLSAVFSNCGFMGLPVLLGIYGKEGVFYGSIYIVVYNLLIWTMGIKVIRGKMNSGSARELILNPAIIAVISGFIFFFFSIKLPAPVFTALDLTGGMTTPVSMFVIGSMLAEINFIQLIKGWTVYLGCAVRLLAVPLLVFPIFMIMGLPEGIFKIILTSAAMPVGAMVAIFADKYDGDTRLASRLVVISTALSIFTLPLVVFVMEHFRIVL
jgi:predicted permease